MYFVTQSYRYTIFIVIAGSLPGTKLFLFYLPEGKRETATCGTVFLAAHFAEVSKAEASCGLFI